MDSYIESNVFSIGGQLGERSSIGDATSLMNEDVGLRAGSVSAEAGDRMSLRGATSRADGVAGGKSYLPGTASPINIVISESEQVLDGETSESPFESPSLIINESSGGHAPFGGIASGSGAERGEIVQLVNVEMGDAMPVREVNGFANEDTGKEPTFRNEKTTIEDILPVSVGTSELASLKGSASSINRGFGEIAPFGGSEESGTTAPITEPRGSHPSIVIESFRDNSEFTSVEMDSSAPNTSREISAGGTTSVLNAGTSVKSSSRRINSIVNNGLGGINLNSRADTPLETIPLVDENEGRKASLGREGSLPISNDVVPTISLGGTALQIEELHENKSPRTIQTTENTRFHVTTVNENSFWGDREAKEGDDASADKAQGEEASFWDTSAPNQIMMVESAPLVGLAGNNAPENTVEKTTVGAITSSIHVFRNNSSLGDTSGRASGSSNQGAASLINGGAIQTPPLVVVQAEDNVQPWGSHGPVHASASKRASFGSNDGSERGATLPTIGAHTPFGGVDDIETISIGGSNPHVSDSSGMKSPIRNAISPINELNSNAPPSASRDLGAAPSFRRHSTSSAYRQMGDKNSLGSASSSLGDDASETRSFLKNTTYPINGNLHEKLSYLSATRRRSETPSVGPFNGENNTRFGEVASSLGENVFRKESSMPSLTGGITQNMLSGRDFMQPGARNSSHQRRALAISGSMGQENISSRFSPVGGFRDRIASSRNMSPTVGDAAQENAYLSLKASPISRLRDKSSATPRSTSPLNNESGLKREDLPLPMSGQTRREKSRSARSTNGSTFKTADDVRQRIQSGNQVQEEYFTVGYRDPFSGVVEKPFTSFDWEQLDTSRNRIQYFKYKGIKVWDIDEGMDNVFGSDGNNGDIEQTIKQIEEELENKALAVNPDDFESDEDDFTMLGSNGAIGKSRDYSAGGSASSDAARATHFLCIRVKNEIVKSMAARVQEHIIREDPALRSCALPSELLHVTLTRIQCISAESVLEVNNILKVMRPRIQDLVGSSEESNPQRTIKVRGLATFGDRVLYAKLDVPASFTAVVEAIHESLGNVKDVVVTSHFEFVPHLTLLKMNRAVARGRGTKTVDVSLYNEYIDQEFGIIAFDNLHFCPIYNIKGSDGFYVTSKKIQF